MRIKAAEFQSAVNFYGTHLGTTISITPVNKQGSQLLYGSYGLIVQVKDRVFLVPSANVKSCIVDEETSEANGQAA